MEICTPLHHHTTTVLRPFFWDHPGEPVPEENFWTLWCKERLTEADTPTIWLSATPSVLTSAHLHHPPYLYSTARKKHHISMHYVNRLISNEYAWLLVPGKFWKKTGPADNDNLTRDLRMQADQNLISKILHNPNHLLYHLLLTALPWQSTASASVTFSWLYFYYVFTLLPSAFAYGPADATATPSSLASLKSRLV